MHRIRSKTKDHWVGWFFDETYRENIDIIWPVNQKQVSAYIERRYGLVAEKDDPSDTFGAMCSNIIMDDGTGGQIISLRGWDASCPKDVSMLTHEVFHCADHILGKRGMPLTAGSTEAYAYLIESIMRRCLILLNTRRVLTK